MSAYAAEDCSVVVDSASNTIPSFVFTISDSAEVLQTTSALPGSGIFNNTVALSVPSGSLWQTIEESNQLEQPLVIDNDEVVEVKETIKYKELAY